MNPGKVWDQLLESARRAGSTAGSPREMRRCRLRLRPEGKAVSSPNKPRRLDLIAPLVREAIRALVSGAAPWPLYLFGPPGSGKTCAALALLDYSGGTYLTAGGMAELLVQAQQGRLAYSESGRSVSPAALWEEWGNLCPLVVLDELATRVQVSDHQYESVKRMLDAREGKPLVAISNLDLDGLAQAYDDRIASRLAAGTIIQMPGADQRLAR